MATSSSHVVTGTKPAALQDHVLYSLAEYCPGLPKTADIVADNQYMGIHPYHMLEIYSKYDDAGKRAEPDVEANNYGIGQLRNNSEQRANGSRGSHGEGPRSNYQVL